jgi:putative cell wall-binding protein
VATGATFPDALAGGPIGGHLGGPVLLTTRDSLPKETIRELGRLAPAKIVVLGGSQAVSTAVAKRLYNYEQPPAS